MKELQERIIQISYENKLTHLGSNLTAVDIIDEIYKKKKPEEKFVLSSGHAHLAHAIVAGLEMGVHCDKEHGCDVSTGSLGMGLPIALGMALANRNKDVYCLISDGECAEGSIWEALRIKSEQRVTNLKVYVNANGYGAYDAINRDALEERLRMFCPDIEFRRTYNEGLQDHYRLVTDKEYGEIKNK